jgi:hypothetical protein
VVAGKQVAIPQSVLKAVQVESLAKAFPPAAQLHVFEPDLALPPRIAGIAIYPGLGS